MTVIADGSSPAELRPMDGVTFGRSSGCELTFAGDPRLSRRAGRIQHLGPAATVTNLSTSHSLFVRSGNGPRERLLPAASGADASARLLPAGEHEITGPTSGFRIVVRVDAHPPPPIEPTGDEPTAERMRTHAVLTLNPRTKEFATALVLCRPKLVDGPTAAVPSVPQLTRAVLLATGSRHLLDRFDADPPPTARSGRRPRSDRDKLTGRIHDHLKQLREKVHTAGLTTARELRPHELADVLIENDVLTRAHLGLLDDPDWLTAQERLWWSG